MIVTSPSNVAAPFNLLSPVTSTEAAVVAANVETPAANVPVIAALPCTVKSLDAVTSATAKVVTPETAPALTVTADTVAVPAMDKSPAPVIVDDASIVVAFTVDAVVAPIADPSMVTPEIEPEAKLTLVTAWLLKSAPALSVSKVILLLATVPVVFKLPCSMFNVPNTEMADPVGTTHEPSKRPPPFIVTNFFIVTNASTVVVPSTPTVNKLATLIPPSNLLNPSTSNAWRTNTFPFASTSPSACFTLN